ncbi:copper amine oxidase [Stachybotrys elegans]|uniref:Amine oxidase n=1 Tax=Stachybotrys elegans TaxID=80388 RepID=A0A8K0SXV5_9HYPO|nr:copper amine oxidase [Stachybotrys elegans]
MSSFKSLIVALLAASTVSAVPSRPQRTWDVHASSRRTNEPSGESCPVPKTIETTAKVPSPFRHLSQCELKSITNWLQAPERGLNLTDPSAEGLSISDNYVWHMEELKPNKTDVLNYLDKGEALPRYARVVIMEGGREEPGVAEYFVGPLPISDNTTVQPLDYFYNGRNGARIGFDGRFTDGPLRTAIDECVIKHMSQIADITMDMTGLVYYGSDDERTNSVYFIPNPYSIDGTQSVAWSTWRRNGLADYDLISDLYVGFDFHGTDPSLWKLRMIVYNNIVYNSIEELREAYEAGKIEMRPHVPTDDSFLRKDRKGPVRELEDRIAPAIMEPDGKRYKVDSNNRYIEYLGWQFYTRYDRDVGIQFYDIKFKGERIMYELSLQDAIAQYSGNNPFQASTGYIDRFYGIGAQVGRLVPGYDCPYHATYWGTEFTSGLNEIRTNSSICIFEADIGVPITRHTDPSYIQSTKGSKLVVRQIATVGNYDYLWDYAFYVDGTVTVDAHASGYVQGTYYRPEDEGKWGPRIHERLSGTLHSHVMNFKADFDLVDEENTFVKTDIIVENVTQPWFPERGTFEMMRYNITELEEETLLPNPANGQSMYTIVNKKHANKWGEARGYRMLPGLSNVHLPAINSPFFNISGQFAKQAFSVSRHHDGEQQSSATLNQNVPDAPLIEFWKYFNGEDISQKDLVIFFNLGMQHYTRSEDIPNTLMSEAHSSIMFAPQNWGDHEGTVDLQNAIIYNRDPDAELVEPETNGVNPPACYALGPEDALLGVFEGMGIPYAHSKPV